MNTLDEIAGSYPVNLDTVEVETLSPLPFPESSVRNRAAMTALLSNNPEGMVEQYQAMLTEAQEGVDYTRQSIKYNFDSQDMAMSQETVMGILADPTLDAIAKQEAINAINSGKYKDTTRTVALKAAEQPSGDENVEQETVRITGAEQFADIIEFKKEYQAIKNRHAASLSESTGAALVDFFESIAPFSTSVQTADTIKKMAEVLGAEQSTGKSIALPGSAKMAVRDAWDNIPPRQKREVAQKLFDIISNNNGIMLLDDNNFQEYQTVMEMLEDEGYSTFDQVLDNITPLLDVIGIGSAAGVALKGTKRAIRTADSLEKNVVNRSVVDTTSPISPARVVEDTNPEKARGMYELVVQSQGDEAAQALYGTTKDEAIGSTHVPQIAGVDGTIESKLPIPDKNITRSIFPDEASVNAYYDNGAIELTATEKAAARANVINRVQEIENFTLHDNMTHVGTAGNQVRISGMYGNTEGGFLDASTLMEQAKFAFAEFGVTEKQLTLMKKVDGEYMPIDLSEAVGVQGNYMVKVDTFHEFNPLDISNFDRMDVKRNFFDRIPVFRSKKAWSLARMITDAASMLPDYVTGGAVVAADRAARMDKIFNKLNEEFTAPYLNLPKDRQAKVYEYVKEANFKGIDLSPADLSARGFDQNEISILGKWRKMWDTHYWFENADLVRTLNIQGYRMFDGANARLFAKPVTKNRNIAKAYDPALDKVVPLMANDIDDLYDVKKGTLAQLRRPTDFGGDVVEHMIVRNTPNEYLRGINVGDQVLNYRKGYFQVHYKAPRFIVQTIRNANGTALYEKAVEVAGSSVEAKLIAKRRAQAEGLPEEDFRVRDDVKQMSIDSDMYFDLQSASGRVAQRHRGKLLEDSTAPTGMFDSQYIADPVESAVRASRSLSGRIASRYYLEMTKQRIFRQYEKYFPERNGMKYWPDESNQLVPYESSVAGELADARTAVEYMNYLQHGYVNSLDEGFKFLMNGMANMLSKLGSKNLEKTFIWLSDGRPMALGKSVAFQAYIALNPLRQWLIQSHQVIRLIGYNPAYLMPKASELKLSGLGLDAYDYLTAVKKVSKGEQLTARQKELYDFVDASGQMAAIDRHSLVTNSILDVAEAHKPVRRTVGKALSIPRKYGFDLGEQTNILFHLLTVRDKYVRNGKNVLDKSVRDEIYSVSRSLTYDMNFAGDMPYNQNWMSLFAQFFQVPHKAVLSVTTNRRLSGTDKLLMAMTDMLLWGVPGATAISNLLPEDMLPKNPTLREIVIFGYESVALNGVFSRMMDEKVKIDFSSLSPYGIEGWAGAFSAILTGGFTELINNSPSANIFFKEGSKMRDAIGRAFRYTGFIDPYEGHSPEDIVSVMDGVAQISSGWANATKAYYIFKSGEILDKSGRPLMENANHMYAVAKLFGFSSMEEALKYKALEALNENKKAYKEEVVNVTRAYMKLLTRQEKLKSTDDEYYIKVMGVLREKYKDDPSALAIVNDELERAGVTRDAQLMERWIEYANIPKSGGVAELENLRMLEDTEIENVRKLHDDIKRYMSGEQ